MSARRWLLVAVLILAGPPLVTGGFRALEERLTPDEHVRALPGRCAQVPAGGYADCLLGTDAP